MKVIVGVGVPGCGKTTYLKPMAKEFDLEYINPDDIRQNLTGNPSDHSQEDQVWEAVHSRLVLALKSNGAIIDATYTKIKDRCQLIELSKQNGAQEIIAYWFNLPIAKCLERNARRKRNVPAEAIMKMYNRLKLNPPTKEEGFNKIIEIKQ